MSVGSTYRTTAQVGPGHRIEIVAPELTEGERVEVTVRRAGSSQVEETAFVALRALNLPVGNEARWQDRERELEQRRTGSLFSQGSAGL